MFVNVAGVGWVRLSTPAGLVDVFNTHLHANYCHDYRQPPADLSKAAAEAAAALTGDAAAAADAESGSRTLPVWHGSRIADDDDAGMVSSSTDLHDQLSTAAYLYVSYVDYLVAC